MLSKVAQKIRVVFRAVLCPAIGAGLLTFCTFVGIGGIQIMDAPERVINNLYFLSSVFAIIASVAVGVVSYVHWRKYGTPLSLSDAFDIF